MAAAREAGTLDLGVETLAVERATVVDDLVLRTDANSGATSHLLTIEIETRLKPVSLERIMAIANHNDLVAWLYNTKSQRVALRVAARSIMIEDGTSFRRFELIRPTRHEYIRADDLLETAWTEITAKDFAAKWQMEVEDAANHVERKTIHLATGLLLPIWSALPADHLVVNRIVDQEGKSWLGRLVFEDHLPTLYTKLGIDPASKMDAAAVARLALAGGSVALNRPFEMVVKRSLVNGQQRVEMTGCPAAQLPWLKSLGCFTEIIRYTTRVFVPLDQVEVILGQIIPAR